MAKGTYERTPLTRARFRLTFAQRKVEKLRGQLAEAELQQRRLQYEVEELEAQEAK